MSDRKVTLKIEAEVTISVDDGVGMDELELEMFSGNDSVDVLDFQTTEIKVVDSK